MFSCLSVALFDSELQTFLFLPLVFELFGSKEVEHTISWEAVLC